MLGASTLTLIEGCRVGQESCELLFSASQFDDLGLL